MNVYIDTLSNGELPSTGLQMFRRFLIRMKFPATTFARNSRSQRPKFDARLAKLEHIFEFPEIFRACGKHLNGEDKAERFLCNIAQLRNKAGLRRADYDSVEMLKQVRDAIQEKMPTIDVDLIGLSRKCNKLVRRIREIVGVHFREAGKLVDEPITPHDDKNWNFNIVFSILGYAFDFDNVNAYYEESGSAIKRGSGSVLEDKTLLRGSARVIEEFLDEVNSDPVVEPSDIFRS
jgi:hypothetical protein